MIAGRAAAGCRRASRSRGTVALLTWVLAPRSVKPAPRVLRSCADLDGGPALVGIAEVGPLAYEGRVGSAVTECFGDFGGVDPAEAKVPFAAVVNSQCWLTPSWQVYWTICVPSTTSTASREAIGPAESMMPEHNASRLPSPACSGQGMRRLLDRVPDMSFAPPWEPLSTTAPATDTDSKDARSWFGIWPR